MGLSVEALLTVSPDIGSVSRGGTGMPTTSRSSTLPPVTEPRPPGSGPLAARYRAATVRERSAGRP
jgi:hypothetical protein